MHTDSITADAIYRYLVALQRAGHCYPHVRGDAPVESEWEKTMALTRMDGQPAFDFTPSAVTFFTLMNGTSIDKEMAYKRQTGHRVFEPDIGFMMTPMSLDMAAEHYQPDSETDCRSAEETARYPDADYSPDGFFPLLWDGSGDYLMVNLIEGSPTHGAVYLLRWAYGAQRVCDSIAALFDGLTHMLEDGAMQVDSKEPDQMVYTLDDQTQWSRYFGETPFFQWLKDPEDTRLIDWKPGTAPYARNAGE